MIRLILIDDHTLVREGVRLMLKSDPMIQVIAEAGTGTAGLQLARERQPDVVLLDLKLPDLSGIEITNRLLRLMPAPKILLLSSATHPEFPLRLLRAGALGYLTKDTSKEELIEAIKTVAKGEPVLRPETASYLAWNKIKPPSSAIFEALTDKEMEVFVQTVRGTSPADIARRMHLSAKTIHSYRSRIFIKLGVENKVMLTLLAIREGLLGLEDTEVAPG